ncbi:MAG: hypothetical protein SCALA702_25330 [Melioribacteraceae bacterium]|nr:MAG: hypothetical protein SCALA702_25330 [Melioribacteraceae bacterium]
MTFNDNLQSAFAASFANSGAEKVVGNEYNFEEYSARIKENIFRAAAEILSDFIYTAILDSEGNYFINWISPSFEKVTGYDPIQFIGLRIGWMDLVEDESRNEYLLLLKNLKSASLQSCSGEYQIITKNGDSLWVRDSIRSCSKSVLGHGDCLIGVVQDIQNEKLIEAAYKHSEVKFRQLFENAQLPIIYYSEEKRILFINRIAASNFKENPINLIGKSLYDLYPAEKAKRIDDILDNVFLNGHIIQSEEIIHTPEELWFNSSYQPVYDAENNVIAVQKILIDITRRKQFEEKIKEYNSDLVKTNQNKDKLFSIIAHDLKSPFISLLGFSEYMVNEFESITKEDMLDYAKSINSSAKNIFSLLENLLQWSRLKTGKIDARPQKFNFNDLLEEVLALFLGTSDNKKIRLINNLHSSDIWVFADKMMVESVLRNLISNAIKFSHKLSDIVISSKTDGRFIEISIRDRGVGMSAEHVTNLFAEETYESRRGTANEKGTGLGLMLCKEFIEKNNGQISVKSVEGEGTEFFFTVPFAQ